MIQYDWESGLRFGHLMLTGKSYFDSDERRRYVEVICDCSAKTIKWVRFDGLKRGLCTSCGCIVKDRMRETKPSVKHGLSSHHLYSVYKHMISRCYDKNDENYPSYGGKNVIVCDEWRNDIKAFFSWAIERWEEGLKLDKDILYSKKFGTKTGYIYSPEYCCFVTDSQNSRKTSLSRIIEHNGESKTLIEWSEDTGLSSTTIKGRIDRYDWQTDEALTKGVVERSRRYNRNVVIFGEEKCLKDWERDSRCVVKAHVLMKRLNRGWDTEKAITTPSDPKYNQNKSGYRDQPAI